MQCAGEANTRNPQPNSDVVGVGGFEPPAFCTRGRCATGLRHTPTERAEKDMVASGWRLSTFFVILERTMGAHLSRAEVEKIASLARLELTDEEIVKYAEQLSAILGYIAQLQEIDTESTPLTSQVSGLSNVMRDDEVEACDAPRELVAMAPESEDNLVKVKAVFE